MTSAHRPTFDHAKGKENKNLSSITHKRGLPSHTKLKFRTKKRKVVSEFDEDNDESIVYGGRKLEGVSGEDIAGLVNDLKSKSVEVDDDNSKNDEIEKSEIKDDNGGSGEGESSDDDSDDEEALLLEMEKIKKEREDAKRKEEEAEIEKRAKSSNPLMLIDDNSNTLPKRKSWRDRKTMNKKTNGSDNKFINNTVKSEFHKNFLDKYVR